MLARRVTSSRGLPSHQNALVGEVVPSRVRKNSFWQSDVSGPVGGDVQIGPERRSGMPRGRIQVAISKGWEGPSDPVGRSAPQADHIA